MPTMEFGLAFEEFEGLEGQGEQVSEALIFAASRQGGIVPERREHERSCFVFSIEFGDGRCSRGMVCGNGVRSC